MSDGFYVTGYENVVLELDGPGDYHVVFYFYKDERRGTDYMRHDGHGFFGIADLKRPKVYKGPCRASAPVPKGYCYSVIVVSKDGHNWEVVK